MEEVGLAVGVVLHPLGTSVRPGPVSRCDDHLGAAEEERFKGARPGEVPACSSRVSITDDEKREERRGLTDEDADFAEAGVEHLVFLVSGAEVVLLGPPQVALLVPPDDLSVPVDIGRDVLQNGSGFCPLFARLVVLDLDLALERFPVLVDGAFDNGTDDDVDFDLLGEGLEGREPVLCGGGIGVGGSVQVSVRVRVLGEVPVLGFADDPTQL